MCVGWGESLNEAALRKPLGHIYIDLASLEPSERWEVPYGKQQYVEMSLQLHS